MILLFQIIFLKKLKSILNFWAKYLILAQVFFKHFTVFVFALQG